MTLMTVGLLIAGLAILTLGADLLVRGASALALVVGISPLVVGLTVVAYGTSAPELAVSLSAGLNGNPDIAVSNVVGSNIFNILFILGACGLIAPLIVSRQLVSFDVPLMIAASLLAILLGIDGNFGKLDGAILIMGIIVYSGYSILKSRKDEAAKRASSSESPAVASGTAKKVFGQLGLIAVGLVLLVVGSRWFVEGAVEIARAFGISDVVIGLTLVAAGTSLPEVATSIMATIKGERDIAIGNVVGSNIYNILAILGIASVVTPGGLNIPPAMIAVDIPVMLLTALVCLPIFFTGYRIERWEAALFFLAYVAYVAFLVLSSTQSASLPAFLHITHWFLMPAAVLAIVVSLVSNRRRHARLRAE